MNLFYIIILGIGFLFSILVTYIFIKSKKILHILNGFVMMATFGLFLYDQFKDTSYGYYPLLLGIALSSLESMREVSKAVKLPSGSGEERTARTNTIIWSITWLVIKIGVIYLVIHNYL